MGFSDLKKNLGAVAQHGPYQLTCSLFILLNCNPGPSAVT